VDTYQAVTAASSRDLHETKHQLVGPQVAAGSHSYGLALVSYTVRRLSNDRVARNRKKPMMLRK
jgi:hypothetical protein